MENTQTEEPTFTINVTQDQAGDLLAIAGITRDAGRYIVPAEARVLTNGHEFTWGLDEAVMWAIRIITEQREWFGA